MSVFPTYPGVYLEEVPSGSRTVTGASTSITAFVGRTLRGPVNVPTPIQSFAGFERAFGGLWRKSSLSYAVRQYFMNGGAEALIIRVVNAPSPSSTDSAASAATLSLASQADKDGKPVTLELAARSEGAWGNNLSAMVSIPSVPDPKNAGKTIKDPEFFHLVIREQAGDTEQPTGEEKYYGLSWKEESPRYVKDVLEAESKLVRVTNARVVGQPNETLKPKSTETTFVPFSTGSGSDGGDLTSSDLLSTTIASALEKAEFNLLYLPPPSESVEVDSDTLADAAALCQRKDAVLLVDPDRSWSSTANVVTWLSSSGIGAKRNAALYFPSLKMADPLREGRQSVFPPGGAIAGLIARNDSARGVWKAPAGLEAGLAGVTGLTVSLSDGDIGDLNQLGVNCIRVFPNVGPVVWGARTLDGADVVSSEWKYLPVRRTALYLKKSLFAGTQWAVFEPNDERLWTSLRMTVIGFMDRLFRQGAFAGNTPGEAYLVKCDREITTQDDVSNGIVNILVGFAPLKPAEFVMIKLQQLAGQGKA